VSPRESSAYAMARRHDRVLATLRAHHRARRRWPTVEQLARRPFDTGPAWSPSRWRDVLEELVLAGRVDRVLETQEERVRRVAWHIRRRKPTTYRRCVTFVVVEDDGF
jgi:hypothetical protein